MADFSQIASLLQLANSQYASGDYKKAWSTCRDILSFDPENDEARRIKEEIETSGKLMKVSATTKTEVKKLSCPSCETPLKVFQKDAETVACSYCGAVCELEDDVLSVLTKVNPSKFKPVSFVELGKVATLDGETFQVVGRICYSSSIREWEDDGYYTSRWKYDEWVLVNNNKQYAYLSEDKEGFSLARSFTPKAPSIPTEHDPFINLDGGQARFRVKEFLNSKIDYFEGEFTWLPKIGGVSGAAEYELPGGGTCSVEWREENGEKKEIEFYKSYPITLLTLARAFGEKEVIAKEEARLKREKELRLWSNGFFAAAALCLCLLFSSCSDGKFVTAYKIDNVSLLSEEGVIRGPFQLTRQGAVHKIKLSGSMPDNSDTWVAVELLDSSQSPVTAIEGDFWRESGRDSEGTWHESNTSKSYLFKLEKPGAYYLRLYGERGAKNRSGYSSMSVEVFEGVKLSRYYFLAMFLCLGYAVSLRKFKKINPILIVVGLIALVAIIVSKLPNDN
jgi:ribosomal protein S27E